MQTFTSRRNLFGSLANDSSTATLTLADTLINICEKKINKKFNFLEDTATITSVDSQQFYDLPNDFGRFKNLYTTSGTTNYYPKLITSREEWDKINATTSTESDVPQYIYIFNGQIGFYPTFASDSLDSTLTYHIKYKDLTVADYTTGTITTLANGSGAVVGDSTVWTAAMIGRWFQISEAQGGDGYWYKIASFTDATHITLDKNYEGTSIAAATATYTIGQTSLLPEDYQVLPVFEALEIFFTSIKPDANKAMLYKTKSREFRKDMMSDYGSITVSPEVPTTDGKVINVNNYAAGSE